jgi:hypothetical protein
MTGAQWAQLAAGVGGTTLAAVVANRNSRRQSEDAADDREMTEEQHLRQTALQESLADPFRHQQNQSRALTSLDMLQHLGKGRTITPPANVAPYAGNVQRSYAPSQTLRDHAALLYNNVAGGNTAPTMTDPANYGRTAAVNLNAGQPGGGGAGAPMTPETMADPSSYLPGQADRRNEGAGGVLKGAGAGFAAGSKFGPYGMLAGTVIGGIAGGLTKNAKSAATDLSLEQAKQAIQAAYQSELGRPASDEEVMGRIAGTGWEPGDEWVGEQGLLYHIREIQNSTERRNRPRAA